MPNKIDLLFHFAKKYDEFLLAGQLHGDLIKNVRIYLFELTTDKILCEQIINSFVNQFPLGESSTKWLKQELQEFDIFIADDNYQNISIQDLHCMSFTYHFMSGKEDASFCNFDLPIEDRINEFVKKTSKISLENLKPGDVIGYRTSAQLSHIAVFIGKVNGYDYAISKFGSVFDVCIHPIDQTLESYGKPEFYDFSNQISSDAANKLTDLTRFIESRKYTTCLSFDVFKKQIEQYFSNVLFFKYVHKNKVTALENEPDDLAALYQRMIERINEQNLYYQNKLRLVDYYGEDGEALKSRITNELGRQKKYLNEIKSQLSLAQSLARLFTLKSNELFEEAKSNKSTASLIIKTPKLVAQISDAQMESITHQDPEMVKGLATILSSHEYTSESAKIYSKLREQVTAEADISFITEKENEAIRKLLININNYLDEKIARSSRLNINPWSLGYFGSSHKLSKEDKVISLPQGIYELKSHLALLENTPPIQILALIKNTLKSKHDEIHDESILSQIKRFVSYIFGYHRSQNTIQEYSHLDDLASGIHPT